MWSGAIFVDPVDRHGFIHNWARLGDLPYGCDLQVLVAPPSACNRQGAAVRDLRDSGRLSNRGDCLVFPGTNHADIERVPPDLVEMSVADTGLVTRLVCGPGGDPASVCALGRAVLESIERFIGHDKRL
jgi:hypothetical protein